MTVFYSPQSADCGGGLVNVPGGQALTAMGCAFWIICSGQIVIRKLVGYLYDRYLDIGRIFCQQSITLLACAAHVLKLLLMPPHAPIKASWYAYLDPCVSHVI